MNCGNIEDEVVGTLEHAGLLWVVLAELRLRKDGKDIVVKLIHTGVSDINRGVIENNYAVMISNGDEAPSVMTIDQKEIVKFFTGRIELLIHDRVEESIHYVERTQIEAYVSSNVGEA